MLPAPVSPSVAVLPEMVSNLKAVDTVGDSAQLVPKYPPPLTAVLPVMVSLVSAMPLQRVGEDPATVARARR